MRPRGDVFHAYRVLASVSLHRPSSFQHNCGGEALGDFLLATRLRQRFEVSARDDDTLETAIRDLLAQRAADSSICPSDVARAVAPDDWRPLMEPVREAARRMMRAGEVRITQGGETVADPETVKGPIRIVRNNRSAT